LVILDHNHLGAQLISVVPALGDNFLKLPSGAIVDFRNFAPEGRRDYSDTAKCSQCPYLFKTYKATYAVECLVFEKIAKN
jgi:hypothetical protein